MTTTGSSPSSLRKHKRRTAVAQEALPIEAEHIADQIGAEAVGLDVHSGTPIKVHIREDSPALFRSIGLKRRMRGANARELITEYGDINGISPICITFVVLRIVAFQQLHMRGRIVACVESRLRRL